MKTDTPGFTGLAGFRPTEIYPFNPDVLREMTYVPVSVSEPTLHRNINRGQGTASRSKYLERCTIYKEATIARWRSLVRSLWDTMTSPKIGRKLTLPSDP
jgi:hypothetical protein